MRKIIAFWMLFALFIVGVNVNAIPINDTEITLLSNTDTCLIDCEAWLEWNFMETQTGFQVPAEASDNWKIEFIRRSIESNDLLDWGTEIWKKKNVSVTDYCLEEIDFDVDLNVATCTDMVGCSTKNPTTCSCSRLEYNECGSHFEKQWQKDADSFFNYHFEKGDVYRIRIWGKKDIKLGENSVDWIPTFNGVELLQWAWWDANWESRFAIIDMVISEDLNADNWIKLEAVNFVALESACVTGIDITIVNDANQSEMSDEVKDMNFQNWDGTITDTNVDILFALTENLPAGTYDGNYYIYSNNDACAARANDTRLAYDTFEDGTIDLWDADVTLGGTMAISTDADKLGTYGARITSDGQDDFGYINYSNDTLFQKNYNMYTWAKVSNVNGQFDYFSWQEGVAETGMIRMKDGGQMQYMDGAALVNWTGFTWSANTWYRLRIKNNGNNTANYYVYDATDTLIRSKLGVNINPNTPDHIVLRGRDTTNSVFTIDMDDTSFHDSNRYAKPISHSVDTIAPTIQYIHPATNQDTNTALITFLVKLDEPGKCYYGIYLNDGLDVNANIDSNSDGACIINYFGFGEWDDWAYLITNQVEDVFETSRFDVQKTGTVTYVKAVGVFSPERIEDEDFLNAGLFALYKSFAGLAIFFVPFFGLLLFFALVLIFFKSRG